MGKENPLYDLGITAQPFRDKLSPIHIVYVLGPGYRRARPLPAQQRATHRPTVTNQSPGARKHGGWPRGWKERS